MSDVDAEQYLNTVHLPENVPEELIPDILEILDRIPRGWGKWVSLDKGWYPLIAQLNKDLASLDPGYELHQVKEKFGTLRYYFGLSPLPEIPCCLEFDAKYPMPRSSWRTDDPKAEEYHAEFDVWSNAYEEHLATEEHVTAHDAQEPLRDARPKTYKKMYKLTDEAERVSMVTCELCGSAGSLHRRQSGWLKTLCENCSIEHGYQLVEKDE